MLSAFEIYAKLLEAYGAPRWWSDDPYIVIFQAVLVQNTSWQQVEKLTNDLDAALTPVFISGLTQEQLENLIRPCGFPKGKAGTIRRLTEWFLLYDCDADLISQKDKDVLRDELLSVKGVGAETADVLLVYAFHKASFIIDAYTRRLLQRLGYLFENDLEIRSFFEQNLPIDDQIYGQYHWLILDHGIQHCKKNPACEGCSLVDFCKFCL